MTPRRLGGALTVMQLRRDPLPRMLVEDLLAIARMLFRSWRAQSAPAHKLQQLAKIGQKLRQALELSRMPVATTHHAEAWQLAEQATEDLGRLVGSEERTLSLVTTVFKGMERPARPSIFQEREAERLRQRRLRS
ncbi:MAG TPA: hypothetical protein VEQ58_00735 [Polyangiaceae bacterium]|nr:hypothetical protein [Polyangiaceae bacterium]